MVNLKYPSALKGKAGIAWLGGIVAGFSPLFLYYLGSLSTEHFLGKQKTAIKINPSHYYIQSFDHNICIAGREMLNFNPTKPVSVFDRRRLALDYFK